MPSIPGDAGSLDGCKNSTCLQEVKGKAAKQQAAKAAGKGKKSADKENIETAFKPQTGSKDAAKGTGIKRSATAAAKAATKPKAEARAKADGTKGGKKRTRGEAGEDAKSAKRAKAESGASEEEVPAAEAKKRASSVAKGGKATATKEQRAATAKDVAKVMKKKKAPVVKKAGTRTQAAGSPQSSAGVFSVAPSIQLCHAPGTRGDTLS